jgi:hypothetical protein
VADMETTYPAGGGVSTTTRSPGLPGLPGGGSGNFDEMLAFFREMARRREGEHREDRQQAALRAAQPTGGPDTRNLDMIAQTRDGEGRNNGASYVRNVGGFNQTPRAEQASAGEPGAVFGGWIPGGAVSGGGGGGGRSGGGGGGGGGSDYGGSGVGRSNTFNDDYIGRIKKSQQQQGDGTYSQSVPGTTYGVDLLR